MTLLSYAPAASKPALYDDDTMAWALHQAGALREGREVDLDWLHLADEIADIAERERDRLQYLLERLIHQQLIGEHGSPQHSTDRAASIQHQHRRIAALLARSPSLSKTGSATLDRAYRFGRIAALRETGLPEAALPQSNPLSLSSIGTSSLRGRSRTRRDDDIHGWALRQSELLQRRRFAELDRNRLADELTEMARRDYLRLRSALTQVLQHLLKWDYQPERRSRSWVLSIAEHRERVTLLLSDHPSLAGRRLEALEAAYRLGRIAAVRETGVSLLPSNNPYSWESVVDRPISWPDPSPSPSDPHERLQ